ncbi:MAG: RNA methyltransferase [Nitrosomonadaceae bacterium]|nr:RNA methyltransferase [Nitrosospira sp.]MDW7564693.1 RNA methyltransferase [Nitrosomonadaceae bacterium]MBI0408836.1 RNA methyltransferase [Nitrosospira sp.]MBI0411030.1 RNA methyltransferase [Nitrosospira sp.]MBI0412508.1 RNA methyltransferase [Nitrosospira sp.]
MNPPCPLANVRVVLSHTSHPGNIGAAARAMKTMGLSTLYLVNPKSFPDKEAETRAAGAWDVLNSAKVCSSLDEALGDTVLAAAITARPRGLSHEVVDSRQGAQELCTHARQHPVALVFGTEVSGLTTVEVSRCQIIVHIPANPDYSSLNLASAVQVMAYELRMALSKLGKLSQPIGTLASLGEIESFFGHLEQSMIVSGFLDPQEPKRLLQRMRRLFARARLEKEEVNILRGILNALQKHR